MASANTTARFRVAGSFSYRKDTGSSFRPVAPASFREEKQYEVTGSGAGVASRGHAAQIVIGAGSVTVVDLAALTDMHTDLAAWSSIKVAVLRHDDESANAASTIEITGAAANAVPGLRSSRLARGQLSVLLFDPDGAGLALAGPDTHLAIANNDGVNTATATLFLEGE